MEKRGDINPAYTPVIDEEKTEADNVKSATEQVADLDADFSKRAAAVVEKTIKGA
jgi:hypothetical protein